MKQKDWVIKHDPEEADNAIKHRFLVLADEMEEKLRAAREDLARKDKWISEALEHYDRWFEREREIAHLKERIRVLEARCEN
jgi:hypothetical protein